jgi:hypothetical protein
MSKTNSYETEYLTHLYNNAAIAGIGDGAGLQPSSTAGSLFIALFTADPTEAGLVANECAYTGYARVGVPRSAGGFTVSGNQVSNTALLEFGAASSGPETVTHFGICKAGTSGVADLIGSAAVDTPLVVNTGVTPRFQAGALVVTED